MNSRRFGENDSPAEFSTKTVDNMELISLYSQIEQSWCQTRDASIVDRLAAEHAEYSTELYEFLSLLVAVELEPVRTRECGEMADATRSWLDTEGFDAVQKIAASERCQTPTTTPTDPPPDKPRRTNSRVVSMAAVQRKRRTTSEYFAEAVVIAALAKQFGSEAWPLSRFKYTKFCYLLRRHEMKPVENYLKKAAGPYNPGTRYKGPEKIVVEKEYAYVHNNGKYEGFVAGSKNAEAVIYFTSHHGTDALTWLEQFRRRTHDGLELLTTVDKAIVELNASGKTISVLNVKAVIATNSEWAPKLSRSVFSDANIAAAIKESQKLFG